VDTRANVSPPVNSTAGIGANTSSLDIPVLKDRSRRSLRFSSSFAVLTLITVAGALLRFHLLGARNIWLDEGVSVWLASLSWPRFIHTMIATPELNMVLYYTLLREWMHLGQTEFAIRSLSALFGIAAIPAIFSLGRRLFDAPTGLIAAALLAAHSFHIRYSQEARAYSLQVFLLILATYFFCRILEAPHSRKFWLAYIALGAAAVYCHVFAVLVLASQWLAPGIGRLRSLGLRVLAPIALGFTLLMAPFAAHMLLEPQQGLSWIPHPTLMFFLGTIRLLTGSGAGGRTALSLSLTLVYGILGVVALWNAYLRRPAVATADERFSVRLLFWWIVLPIASTLLFSIAVRPIFYSRFLLMCVPAIALLAAQGISAFSGLFTRRKTLVLAGVAALTLLLSLAETRRYFQTFPTYGHQWGAVVHHIFTNEQPGDAVAISMGIEVFEYYEHREAPGILPPITFPPELGDGDRGFEPEPVLRQASLGHSRVWLVFPLTEKASIDANVPQGLHRINETVFPGSTADGELHVVLFGVN
jgi:mannosyltransferase